MSDSAVDFSSLRATELKALLKSKGVSIDGCFDKDTLLERALQFRSQVEAPAPAAVPDLPAWGGDDPLEQGPAQGALASLILLHGFGDTGSGFISQMGGPMIAMDGLRVLFPSAPRATYGGFPVSSWLEAPNPPQGIAGGMAAATAMMRADSVAVQRAVDYVHALIRREVARGVPAERIVVGGFSQGGLVAVRAALSFPDGTLGGCLALSTFFGAESAPVAEANARLSILVAHGEDDPIVPKAEGLRIVERLGAVAPSARVRFESYPGMAHASCPAEAADVRAFVERVMRGGATSEEAAAEAPAETSSEQAAAEEPAAEAPADIPSEEAAGEAPPNTSSEETAAEEPAAEAPQDTPSEEAAGEAPGDAAPAVEPSALTGMSTAELKAFLRERGVSAAQISACFERADLLERALVECAR